MPREIIGSMLVRGNGVFRKNERFRLVFVTDRIVALADDPEIAEFFDRERGRFDRSAALSADDRNFEVPYREIRSVTMKKGGISFGLWDRTITIGSIRIETFSEVMDYRIESRQDYRSCARTVSSVLGDRLIDRSKGPAYRYCPQCREEFQEWVTRCPDCDVVLVEELPQLKFDVPVPEDDAVMMNGEFDLDTHEFEHVTSDGLVSVAVAPNELIAEMWKGLLDEQGIPCMVKRTGHLSHSRYYAPGVGNCEIIVTISTAKRAFAILQPFLDV